MLFLAIIAAVVLVALITFVVGSGWSRWVNHPEETATHAEDAEPRDSTSERFYATSDRPAGPDAEDPPAP